MVSFHSCHAHARSCSFDAPPHVVEDREEVDITDAECVLEDLVSKGCVVAVTRQISDEVGEEGGVPRLGEVDFCTEER